MKTLVTLTCWYTLGFLITLAAVVLVKMLAGTISLNGLLIADRRGGSTQFSLGRTQLLVCTTTVVASYVRQVIAGATSLTSLPDVPAGMVQLLIGSELFYLAGKARALWFDPTASASTKGKSQ